MQGTDFSVGFGREWDEGLKPSPLKGQCKTCVNFSVQDGGQGTCGKYRMYTQGWQTCKSHREKGKCRTTRSTKRKY